MADFVMVWNCSYCRTKGILGYIYSCSGCGHPRPKGVKFYMPEPMIEATPDQMALMGGHDPNWYCEHCDSGNVATDSKCWSCGAEKGSSPSHQQRVYTEDELPHSEEEVPDGNQVISHPSAVTHYGQGTNDFYGLVEKRNGKRTVFGEDGRMRLKVGIGAGLIFMALLTYFLFFRTHEVLATVSGFSWTQNVALEEYQTLHEEGWSVPAGGRETRSETRQSGWRTVHDGYRTETYSDTCYRTVYESKTCYRDNGNGSSSSYDCGGSSSEGYSCTKTRSVEITHQEPVYGTWHFYDIERWVNIGNYPTSGDDHKPYFDQDVQAEGDKQRRVEQTGSYIVHFACQETGNFDRSYDLDTWMKIRLGQEFIASVNALNVILDVRQK
jgi:hypothetical protein